MIRLGNVKFRASSNFPIALDFQYICIIYRLGN